MNSIGVKATGLLSHKNVVWIILAALAVMLTASAIMEMKWRYLVILIAPFLIYLSFERPFIFPFGLYAFSIPFENLLVMSGAKEGATLTKVLGVATILALVPQCLFNGRLKNLDKAALLWISFALFCFLSVTWAASPELPVQRLPTIIGLAGLYVIASAFRVQKKDYEMLKWCILSGGVIASILTIYGYQHAVTEFGAERISLMALGDDGNSLAGVNKQAFDMLLPVSICLGMMLGKGKLFAKSLFFLVFVVMFFGVFLTGSRGGLFGCLGVLLCFIIFTKKRIKFGILIAVTLIAMLSVMPHFYMERIYEAANSHADGRTDIWRVGWNALKKYWLFGAGLDGFPKAYSEFVDSTAVFKGLDRAPHNIFLGNFVELGIVGISLMIAALIKHYHALRPKTEGDDLDLVVLKAAFWGIMISSLALDVTWYKTLWLLLTMIMMQKYISGIEGASPHSATPRLNRT